MIPEIFEIAVALTTAAVTVLAFYARGQIAGERKAAEARLSSKSELVSTVTVEEGAGGDASKAEEPDR